MSQNKFENVDRTKCLDLYAGVGYSACGEYTYLEVNGHEPTEGERELIRFSPLLLQANENLCNALEEALVHLSDTVLKGRLKEVLENNRSENLKEK